ncbi:MAG TPA: ArsB/NhaD family transporter [Pseudonocardiaceae bacterium]|jgi:arsenical pump membrane protein|nr:ArsB/NhaD family transporter [Pseudonocardiaceae bacterium]
MRNGLAAELISVALLLAVLAFAVVRPKKLPEAVAAVPAAGIVLLLGLASPSAVGARVLQLLPTVAFLAAILVLAHLADTEGVFDWLGSRLALAAQGSSRRLLVLTFAAAAGTTAVLSLDATVVLLTPVVFATATALRLRAKPHVYACTHLANSASTLLPVSNLTNLLAFGATGLSFLSFTGLMVLPWLVSIGIELAVFWRFFSTDLSNTATEETTRPARRAAPRFALVVLGAVLVGFGLTSLVGLAPVWIAAAGAVVLAVRGVRRKTVRVKAVAAETSPLFLLFVLGLAVVVEAVADHGLGRVLAEVVPRSPGLLGLLAAAGLAALLANLVNNLPATLVLLPALGAHPAAGIVLAVLLGVNIGPNLSYVGSLATLLWRRILAGRGMVPTVHEFVRLGVFTVPAALVGSAVALWLGLLVAGSTG